jgi:hypothetical protein
MWVVLKQDVEINEQIFNQGQPDEFKDSIRDDLIAVAALGDKLGDGREPSETEQRRAKAGIRDMNIKSKYFSLYKAGEAPSPWIRVKVHTVKAGKEISKWTVWYVVDGWSGDKDHTISFDRESSPTEQKMLPGQYQMWVSRRDKRGPPKIVLVGDIPSLTKELELEVP